MDDSSSDLTSDTQIPLPIALGGIGLILAWVFPSFLSGGAAFLVGFALGVAVLYVIGYGEGIANAARKTTSLHEPALLSAAKMQILRDEVKALSRQAGREENQGRVQQTSNLQTEILAVLGRLTELVEYNRQSQESSTEWMQQFSIAQSELLAAMAALVLVIEETRDALSRTRVG